MEANARADLTNIKKVKISGKKNDGDEVPSASLLRGPNLEEKKKEEARK